MSKVESLMAKIEAERKALDEMLATATFQDTLEQSRKLDELIEAYIDLTE